MERVSKVNKIAIEMFHSEKMSSLNCFQTKGLQGLAISSRFFRSVIKLTEKATAVLVPMATRCVCMKCLSLNLKELSSSMIRKVLVSCLWELVNCAHSDLRSVDK